MKLSIIIPAYNVEEYIEEALQSVLSQTVMPDEVIVIDDGSVDGTPGILQKFHNNGLFKLLRTKNQGLGPARNLGFSHSMGDYVYFLDSDDFISANFVEGISKYIKCFDQPDMVFFSGASFSDQDYEGGFFPDYLRRVDQFTGTGPQAIQRLFQEGTFFLVHVCMWPSGHFWRITTFSLSPYYMRTRS